MDRGYPRLITWDFQRVGSRVDAVFENYGETLLVFGHVHFVKMLPRLIYCMFPLLQAICISHLDPGRASTTFL